MFDFKQDIGLLHGSLLSIAYSNTESQSNKKDSVDVVYDSVKMIIKHSLSGVHEENAKFKVRLQSSERLHAAVFFTMLRSYDINSEDANCFYESILYNWPSVDLEFYVKLNFKCDWGEYFIKCALQLPPDVLFKVLKMMLAIPVDFPVQCYLWHLIIQTIILKLFNVSHSDDIEYPFNLNFSAKSLFIRDCCISELNEKNNTIALNNNKLLRPTEIITDVNKGIVEDHTEDKTTDIEREITEEDMVPLCKKMFNQICENISILVEVSNDIEVVKIICHGIKLLLKCVAEKRKYNMDTLLFIDVFRLNLILEKCLISNTGQEILKAELLKCSNKFVSHTYATASWDISVNYLIFLLSYYFNKVQCRILSYNELSEDEKCIHICKAAIRELVSFSAPFLESDEFFKILYKTVQFGFQHTTYVAKHLLSKSAFVEREDFLMVLENNCHNISLSEIYPSLLGNITKVKTQGSKLKLLNIFYKCLQGVEISTYNSIIGFILKEYGITKKFQLPDFDDQLSEFAWKTPTLKQAEDMLPVLFVQNPFTVMKYLIDQVLVQGSKGKPFIQVLKHFDNACLFRGILGDSDMMLHVVLEEYFKKDKLEAFELKNMILLYEFLVEVHLETPVFSPCLFFEACIVPKLHLHSDKIALLLECAHILMPTLLSEKCFQQSPTKFSSFIISFARLLDDFIVKGNGRMKTLVINLLKKFEVYQLEHKYLKDSDKEQLWSALKDLQEMTCVYIKDFLPENIEFKTKCYVWTWCCRNENSTFFEKSFITESLCYISLINTLIRVFPHLTKEEWLYSMNLLKICCENHKLIDEITHLNNPFKLSGFELKIYAVIVAVVTSLHCILGSNADNMHISSCFSNTLMNFLDQEGVTHTHVLLAAFLEVCYLVSHVSQDLISIFNPTLLALKKQIILSNPDYSVQSDYMKLLSDAITCLPDSVKDCVIQSV